MVLVPWISIVAGQTDLTVRSMCMMCTVALAGLIVAVTLQRVTMSITLTWHATFTT